jgi:hypothetical protein
MGRLLGQAPPLSRYPPPRSTLRPMPAGQVGWVLLASAALTAIFAPLTMYLYRNPSRIDAGKPAAPGEHRRPATPTSITDTKEGHHEQA